MPKQTPHHQVLLLGGTAEARVIADNLARRDDVSAVLSLAGVLSQPPELALPLRIGGFGGVEGLVQYIHDHGITTVIDATHPYAAQMSAHAVAACDQTGARRLSLWRPPWQAELLDDWTDFEDWHALMATIPNGARVFLAAGQDGMNALPFPFDFTVIARALARPKNLPEGVTLIKALPGKTPQEEAAIFQKYRISHLICKNSGGDSSRAKLLAARGLKLPVLMIKRPLSSPPPLYDTPDLLLAAL
jgi:precorrin-6A/cobalt-precorrin-6A reductase